MEEENKALFIQQRINLLSGGGDTGSGDYRTSTTKRKSVRRKSNKPNKKLLNEETRATSFSDENYSRLIQIVDFNRRNVENCNRRPVTDDLGSNKQKLGQEFKSNPNSGIEFVNRRKNEPENQNQRPVTDDLHGNKQEFKTNPDGGIEFDNRRKNEPEKFVAKELLNRIKTEHILNLAKKANRSKIHDPKKCKFCVKKEENLAKYEFLKHRKTKLESELLDIKVDNAIHTTDTVMFIGDLAGTLPKLSDDRQEIWNKLLRKKD